MIVIKHDIKHDGAVDLCSQREIKAR